METGEYPFLQLAIAEVIVDTSQREEIAAMYTSGIAVRSGFSGRSKPIRSSLIVWVSRVIPLLLNFLL